MSINKHEKDVKIFRFKLTNELVEMINEFSKIHQYDDKKIYKEKWKEWLEINSEIIDREKERLINLGCNKNIEEKMYRSGRYYFRKKTDQDKKVTQRRKYISCDFNFIELIDNHINDNIKLLKTNFKPSKEYIDFEETHNNDIKTEIDRIHNLSETNNITKEDIVNKIKKTYKNRYYLISH
jgi:hypothetical protein